MRFFWGSDLRWFFAVFPVFPQFGPFLDAKHEQVEVRRAPPRSPRSLRIWGSTRSPKNPPKKYGNCANPVVFPQSRAASSWAPSWTCSGSASGRSSRARGGGDRNSSFPRGVFAPKHHFSPRTGSNLSFFFPSIPFFPLFPPVPAPSSSWCRRSGTSPTISCIRSRPSPSRTCPRRTERY